MKLPHHNWCFAAFVASVAIFAPSALAQQNPAVANSAPAPALANGGSFLPFQSTLRDPAWEAARRPAISVQNPGDSAVKLAGGAARGAVRQIARFRADRGASTLHLTFGASQAGKPVQILCLGGGTVTAAGINTAKDATDKHPRVGSDGVLLLSFQPPASGARSTLLVELESVRTLVHLVRE